MKKGERGSRFVLVAATAASAPFYEILQEYSSKLGDRKVGAVFLPCLYSPSACLNMFLSGLHDALTEK